MDSMDIRVSVPAHIRFTMTGETTVLMDMRSGVYVGFDPVATRIWQLLVEHGQASTALAALLAEYDVAEETLRKDLLRFLHDCRGKQLLTLTRTNDGKEAS